MKDEVKSCKKNIMLTKGGKNYKNKANCKEWKQCYKCWAMKKWRLRCCKLLEAHGYGGSCFSPLSPLSIANNKRHHEWCLFGDH
jgi:hypothetical protein